MARRASVRYWPTRKAYCCWFKGKQYVLAEGPDDYPGPTYQAAVKKFAQLTTLEAAERTKDGTPVGVVCDRFLGRCATDCRQKTYESHRDALSRFVEAIDPDGLMPSSSLTVAMVRGFLVQTAEPRENGQGRVYRWGKATQALAARSIRAAFRWAVRDGLLSRNPIEGLPAPTARSRGREYLIGRTPAERAANHARIVAAAPKAFKPFVIALEATGARPGEIAAATASDYNREIGAIVYHSDDTRLDGEFRHKTSGHGKERTIFLTGEARRIVEELVSRHQTGPLFRTRGNKAWTPATIARYFIRIRRAVGLPKLSAYSYRHTYATAWLEKGKSVDVLAALLGNSPEVIRRHYSHLLGDVSNLRRQVDLFRGEGADTRKPAGGAA
jgi:integrase